jgi:hypothetical protein
MTAKRIIVGYDRSPGAKAATAGARHRHPIGFRHGDVPLAVARTAACPVAVVPREQPSESPL